MMPINCMHIIILTRASISFVTLGRGKCLNINRSHVLSNFLSWAGTTGRLPARRYRSSERGRAFRSDWYQRGWQHQLRGIQRRPRFTRCYHDAVPTSGYLLKSSRPWIQTQSVNIVVYCKIEENLKTYQQAAVEPSAVGADDEERQPISSVDF